MSRKGNRGKKKKTLQEQYQNTTTVIGVHVATPAYDGKVDTYYAQSMLMAGQMSTVNGIEVSGSVMGNGAFIELARNVFVKQFLDAEDMKDFTYFMFIDADLGFEPRAIAGLVRTGLPLSAGVYRRRQEPESYPARWITDGENEGLWVRDGFVAHDRVPTGFMCIRRDVLERMVLEEQNHGVIANLPEHGDVPWLFGTKFDEERRFVGEDFVFCDKYMKLYREGVFDQPIWVWPDFDFNHGGYKCNYQHWLAKSIEENEGRRKGSKRT